MRRRCSAPMMPNSLAALLLLALLLAVASSRFGVAAEAASTPPVFDVDDALAAARARAAAGGGAPLSPAAAATAGRTAMANACGPGLGRCSLARGGCCSERGTCGWECRGACQGEPWSAPGFCQSSVSSPPPPPAASLPLAAPGSPCGAYLARCGTAAATAAGAAGGGREGKNGSSSSCCGVLSFCVAAPSPLCSDEGDRDGGGSDSGGGDGEARRTTRRFRLVATRGDVSISSSSGGGPGEEARAGGIWVNGRGPPHPPPSLSASAGDRVVVEFVNALEEPSALHFHGVRWRDGAHEDGAAGVAQRAVAAGGAGAGAEEAGGAGAEEASPLAPPPVFAYDFVARDPGTFWWHSHVRGQAADGLRGTLVVRGEAREGAAREGVAGEAAAAAAAGGAARGLPRRRRRQPEATLFVSDWYGAPARDALRAYLSEENVSGREPTPDALTINGRSWRWFGGGLEGGGGGGDGSDGSDGGASSSPPLPLPPPPPPSFSFSDPRGDPRRRSLARCSEPKEEHALVRVVNGGAFATVAVSFVEAAAEGAEEAEAAGARSAAAAESRPKLRATVVSADAVPTVPTVLDPARPLRLGVGQRHDVELCSLEGGSESGSGDGGGGGGGGDSSDGGSRGAAKKEEIASVWAVAVADGALFDAPMRLSNATAAVLRFGGGDGGAGGGGDFRRLLPPAGVDLSDAGAAAAAPPAFSFSSPSSSSPSTSHPRFAAVPSPEPTVFHRLTISFNKQQKKKGSSSVEGGKGGGAGGSEEEGKTEGPRYSVEGFSQRPRGLDDPRRPSILETEREKKAMLSSSYGGNSSSSSKEEEEEEGGEWNLYRHSLGSVVEMRVRNEDDVEHSWHLHGHNFWVVESSSSGGGSGSGGEEDEGGAGGAKKGRNGAPGIAEARDTVLVPARSSIRARYVVDSPGAFLAHCHMLWHEAAGLAAVMVDGV